MEFLDILYIKCLLTSWLIYINRSFRGKGSYHHNGCLHGRKSESFLWFSFLFNSVWPSVFLLTNYALWIFRHFDLWLCSSDPGTTAIYTVCGKDFLAMLWHRIWRYHNCPHPFLPPWRLPMNSWGLQAAQLSEETETRWSSGPYISHWLTLQKVKRGVKRPKREKRWESHLSVYYWRECGGDNGKSGRRRMNEVQEGTRCKG